MAVNWVVGAPTQYNTGLVTVGWVLAGLIVISMANLVGLVQPVAVERLAMKYVVIPTEEVGTVLVENGLPPTLFVYNAKPSAPPVGIKSVPTINALTAF